MAPKTDELLESVGLVEFVYLVVVAPYAVAKKKVRINISCGRNKRVEMDENEGKDLVDPRSNANIITTSGLRSRMHRKQQDRKEKEGKNKVGTGNFFSKHGGVRNDGDDLAYCN